MSANYDKNQKFSFVYSNLYQIYRKGKEAARAADLSALKGSETFHVLKTEGVEHHAGLRRAPARPEPEIREYRPVELMGKRVQHAVPELREPALRRHSALPQPVPEDLTLKSLKQNLNSLTDLHQRLRFMLSELEELVKE
ncbi:MAG: hypothetical protein IT285_05715 [Bdellovibrionales bacterium]|nr:hypothetical protein [Bdellovibrionales bacterium]